MKLALRDYAGNVSKVQIASGESFIAIIEMTGDQVLVYPFLFDTGAKTRLEDHFDGHKIFRVDEFEEHEIDGEICLLVPRI